MKNYKQWTEKDRLRGLRIVNKAIKDGLIPKASKCCHCGKTDGKIMYHQENYDDPLNPKNLREVCWRCHLLIYHSKPELKQKYLKELEDRKKI